METQHHRATRALQVLADEAPKPLATWILAAAVPGRAAHEVLEARQIHARPSAKMYPVPDLPKGPSAEEVLSSVLGEATMEAFRAEAPGLTVQYFDPGEARRQSILAGGDELTLLVRLKSPRAKKPKEVLLGVPLPAEGDDGRETPKSILARRGWYSDLAQTLRKDGDSAGPIELDSVPLYLWPGSGLLDPQEDCLVGRGEPQVPSFLQGFTVIQPADSTRLKKNKDRLKFHRALDQARRAAAARWAERFGRPQLTEAELTALVPEVDVEQDRIDFRLSYSAIRLWEHSADELLSTLPAACVGLSLFGFQPEGSKQEDALRKCAWTLRKLPAAERRAAAAMLSLLAEVHLDPALVKRELAAMQLGGRR